MTFRGQLVIGFGAVVSISIVCVVITAATAVEIIGRVESATTAHVTEESSVEHVRFRAERLVAVTRGALLSGRVDTPTYEDAIAEFRAAITEMETHAGLAGTKALIDLELAAARYLAATETAMRRRAEASDPDSIVPFFERSVRPQREALDRALEALIMVERERFRGGVVAHRRVAQRNALLAIIATLLGAIGAACLAIGAARKLSRIYLGEQRAVARAEEAARAREEILAVVSHDLRNPLNAILMSIWAITPHVAPMKGRHLEIIRNASERMKRLIEDLLDSERIADGAIALRPEICKVQSLLVDAVGIFEAQAEAKSIFLECNVESREVWADRERVLQILSNLIGNAMKFTPEGGHVEIDARDDDDGFVRFSISDSGPGIDSQHLDHVFERRWQADRRGPGLGLGLYIAKSLVELQGGRIWVQSRPGDGSTFCIALPAPTASAVIGPAPMPCAT